MNESHLLHLLTGAIAFSLETIRTRAFGLHQSCRVERLRPCDFFCECPRDADANYLQSADIRVYFNSRSSSENSFFIPPMRLRRDIIGPSNLPLTLRESTRF